MGNVSSRPVRERPLPAAWLNGLREAKGLESLEKTYSAREQKEKEFDRVADSVRSALDMKRVYEIMGMGEKA